MFLELARILGIQTVGVSSHLAVGFFKTRESGLVSMTNLNLHKIEFYIPESHLDMVKEAMFKAGAGRVGSYDSCSWQTLGRGQFKAQEGSQPFIGSKGSIETVPEYKVEMVCEEQFLSEVIFALKDSHPYEEVAYSVIRLRSID